MAAFTSGGGGGGGGCLAPPVPPAADLEVACTDDHDPAVEGTDITYDCECRNTSAVDADQVILTDPVPTGATLVDAPGCTVGNNRADCDVGPLAAGASVRRTFVLRANLGVASIANRVFATWRTGNGPPGATSDVESTTIIAGNADISATATPSNSNPPAGDPATLTFLGANGGPGPANNFTFTVNIPAGVNVSNIIPATLPLPVAGTSTAYNVGSVPSGGSSQIQVTIQTNTQGLFNFSVSVNADQNDPDTADRQSSARVIWGPPVVRSLAVTPPSSNILPTQGITLAATGQFSDGTSQDLTTDNSTFWSSSNAMIAHVGNGGAGTPRGRVSGIRPGGPVTITAMSTLANPSVSGTAQVTVDPLPDVNLNLIGPPTQEDYGEDVGIILNLDVVDNFTDNVALNTAVPTGMRFRSLSFDPAFSCATPVAGAAGPIVCTAARANVGAFSFTLRVQTRQAGITRFAANVTTTSPQANTLNDSDFVDLDVDDPYAFIYAAGDGTNGLSQLSLDDSGDIHFLDTHALHGTAKPLSVEVDKGRRVMAVTFDSNELLFAKLQPPDGIPIPYPQGPLPTGNNPVDVKFADTPGGKKAYVANKGSSSISFYDVDLFAETAQEAVGSPSPTPVAPDAIEVDPRARTLAPPTLSTHVLPHILDRSGNVTTTQLTFDMNIFMSYLPSGEGALGADASGNVAIYLFDQAGAAQVPRRSSVATPGPVGRIVVDETGVCAFVNDTGSRRTSLRIDELNGGLMQASSFDTGVRLGFGVAVISGDVNNAQLQSFVVNTHDPDASGFNISVFGFQAQPVPIPAAPGGGTLSRGALLSSHCDGPLISRSSTSSTPASDLDVWRFTPLTPNPAVTASIQSNVSGLTADLIASSTGRIVRYHWDFGDGTAADGFSVAHTFALPGTYTVTLTVADNLGNIAQDSVMVTVSAPVQPLVINTVQIVCGVGNFCSVPIGVTGGTGPYMFSGTGFPVWLNLDAMTGVASGTAQAGDGGVSSVNVTVQDASVPAQMVSSQIPLHTLEIITPSLPDGMVGVPYSQNVTAAGGPSGTTWASLGGLPPGLNLNIMTGQISGTPTQAGTFTFQLFFGASISNSKTFTITIHPAATPTLISINVTLKTPDPSTLLVPSVPVGVRCQFAATGTFSDSSTMDVTEQASWGVSPSGILTVSNTAGMKGSCTTQAPGTAMVTATIGAVNDSETIIVDTSTLTGITVTPANATLADGLTMQYQGTGLYSNGNMIPETTGCFWSIINTSIATVSNAAGSRGLVTAVNPGTTTVRCIKAGFTGATQITVTPAVVTSIVVSLSDPNPLLLVVNSLPVGRHGLFTANGNFSDGTSSDVTNMVTWTSDAPSVVTVSDAAGSKGEFDTLAPGAASVTATLGSIFDTAQIIVDNSTPTSITVVPVNPTISDGLMLQFTAAGTYSTGNVFDETDGCIWDSSDPTVATISDAPGSKGLATAISPGPTDITCTFGGVSGATLLIVDPAALTAIRIEDGNPANGLGPVPDGIRTPLRAIGTFTDGSQPDMTQAVNWGSSAPAVATVGDSPSNKGVMQTLVPGVTQITVTDTMTGTVGMGMITIHVVPLNQVLVNPATFSLGVNSTPIQLHADCIFTTGETFDCTEGSAWSSSNTGVGTVSDTAGTKGLFDGISVGVTDVLATKQGVSGQAQATVTAATMPGARCIVAGNFGTGTLSSWIQDQSTGALTAKTPLVITPPGVADYLTDHPSGKFVVAVVNRGSITSIDTFAVDPNNCNLSDVPGDVVSPGFSFELAVSPNGTDVFLGNGMLQAIVRGAINPVTGVVTLASMTNVGGFPDAMDVSPNGKYLVVVVNGQLTIREIQPGSLPQVAGSPAMLPGVGFSDLEITATGSHLCYVDTGRNGVECIPFDQNTGALNLPARFFFSTGSGSHSMEMIISLADPNTAYAYVTGNPFPNGSVSGHSVNLQTGAATPVAGFPRMAAGFSGCPHMHEFPFLVVNFDNNGVEEMRVFQVDPNTGGFVQDVGAVPAGPGVTRVAIVKMP